MRCKPDCRDAFLTNWTLDQLPIRIVIVNFLPINIQSIPINYHASKQTILLHADTIILAMLPTMTTGKSCDFVLFVKVETGFDDQIL